MFFHTIQNFTLIESRRIFFVSFCCISVKAAWVDECDFLFASIRLKWFKVFYSTPCTVSFNLFQAEIAIYFVNFRHFD